MFLLILVFSAPANFDKRTIIRKTWATDPSLKIRWRSVFPLGQAAGDNILNKKLEAEGMMYGDLIRGSYNEHYQNLTFKTQMGLEWAAKYCADFQFLLKADDDVFINPYALIDHLRIPDTPKTNLYTGSCVFFFWRYSISRWKEWSYLGRVQQDQISPILHWTGVCVIFRCGL